jgi:hypothetical protein
MCNITKPTIRASTPQKSIPNRTLRVIASNENKSATAAESGRRRAVAGNVRLL